MKQELATFIDYDELDTLVKAEYGHDWEFCVDRESSNDVAYSWHFKKEPLDKWAVAKLTEFKQSGKGAWLASTLIQDLINQGKLSEGRLVISVSW